MSDVADMLLSIPGAAWVWHGLADWRNLPVGEMLWQAIERILQIAGLFEFYRLIDQRIFRSRSKLEMELEASESRVHERNNTISALRGEKKALEADLADARERLPAAAIARADREVRDLNHERATRHLEQWFTENAESIAAIAKRLAKYHIPRVVPAPGDHLRRARDMLRLAEGALPLDIEVREISRELDRVNADLQAQIPRDGDAQIAWNAAMAGGPGAQGDALIPLIITLRDMARWFFDRGLWRLAPLFADRAAELARDAGRQHRRMWYGLEGQAAFYQTALGHSAEALRRIDDVLSQGRETLSSRDEELLLARLYRAIVLSRLGRYGDALAEIDAFAPVQAEVLGARHPNTLATRHVRAEVLSRLGRYGDALAEIDAFAPIETEVLGARHPNTLATRHLRAEVLSRLGRYGDALAEIDAFAPIQAEVLGARHPDTLTTRFLRADVLSRLGRYGDALAEIDAFAPIQAEVSGARHPDTLATRYLRADVLSRLGCDGDALAEIDAFAPIQAEVLGARHPNTLATRFLRADVLSRLGRYGDALAEIDAFAPIRAEVLGARHPDTLATRKLRADVLSRLGRHGDALAEVDAFAPVQTEVSGARHPDTLTTRFLRADVLSRLGRYGDALAEIDAFAPIQAEVSGPRHPDTLTTRYLRADVQSRLGRYGEALAEIDAFAPIQAEVLGARHPFAFITRSLRIGIDIAAGSNIDHTDELQNLLTEFGRLFANPSVRILTARYRLARQLLKQGAMVAARAEISRVIADFDPSTNTSHELLRSAKALLEMIEGRATDHQLIP